MKTEFEFGGSNRHYEMLEFVSRATTSPEDPGKVASVVCSLVSELRKIEKSLKLYAGEAYWLLFDHPEITRSFQTLADRSVRIQIVAGPVLSKGGSKHSPRIIELAENGIVEIYYRAARGESSHFRIADDEVVMAQPSHDPLTPLRLRPKPQKIRRDSSPREFQRYSDEFHRVAIDDNRSCNPREQFLVLEESDLKGVVRLAAREGLEYNALEKVELEELLERFNEDRKQLRIELSASKSLDRKQQ